MYTLRNLTFNHSVGTFETSCNWVDYLKKDIKCIGNNILVMYSFCEHEDTKEALIVFAKVENKKCVRIFSDALSETFDL